jgi:hypothetical protein
MGFALWLRDGAAWAQGTHEYKPMGAAVIAETQLFRARDFSRRRVAPARKAEGFQGLFASLEDLNAYLRRTRGRPRSNRLDFRKGRLIPIL